MELLKTREKLKSVEKTVKSQKEIISQQRIENNELRKANKEFAKNQLTHTIQVNNYYLLFKYIFSDL